jgi:hypothetical protein
MWLVSSLSFLGRKTTPFREWMGVDIRLAFLWKLQQNILRTLAGSEDRAPKGLL